MASNLVDLPIFVKKLKAQTLNMSKYPRQQSRMTAGRHDGHQQNVQSIADLKSLFQNGFTVFKLESCPYSEEAESLISKFDNSKSYYIHDDLHFPSKDAFKIALTHAASMDMGQQTFPMVFLRKQYIGGCFQLKRLLMTHAASLNRDDNLFRGGNSNLTRSHSFSKPLTRKSHRAQPPVMKRRKKRSKRHKREYK